MSFRQTAASILKKLGNTLFPPLCLKCHRVVEEDQGLCPSCWPLLCYLDNPLCDQCGYPFDFSESIDFEEQSVLCASCIASPPSFLKHRSAIIYNEASRPLILKFKHGDCLASSTPMAQWMHRAGRDLIAQCDVLIPVPLHRWRLWQRRYNQASVLAQKLSILSEKPVVDGVLVRYRATKSQGHLTFSARQKNVKGVFNVVDDAINRLKGKSALLVDDVFTTGATLEECARTLERVGCSNVNALTLARVVLPGKGRRI